MLELVEKPVPEPGDGEVRIRGWCRASIRPTGSRAAARSAGWRRRRRCPTLLDRCARLAWHRVPAGDCTRDRGHGRVEVRTLKAVSVRHFGFPHAAQVLHVIRKTRDLGSSRWRTVTVYAITSLPFELARPARLADLLRGHWVIENGLHYVRDTAFAEDVSRSAPAAHRTPRPACGTWPSESSAGPSRSTSPPPCAATPATHADPGHPRDEPRTNSTSRHNDGAPRSRRRHDRSHHHPHRAHRPRRVRPRRLSHRRHDPRRDHGGA